MTIVLFASIFANRSKGAIAQLLSRWCVDEMKCGLSAMLSLLNAMLPVNFLF